MHQFEAFAKIPRFFRDVTISEKIDGTNAQVFVSEDGTVMAGSRSRWITRKRTTSVSRRGSLSTRTNCANLGLVGTSASGTGEAFNAGTVCKIGVSRCSTRTDGPRSAPHAAMSFLSWLRGQ